MFVFDELTFITHLDLPDEDLHPDTRADMTLARIVYPELENWSLSGLFNAASELSQSVLAAGWPEYEFGSFGWFQCEVWELGAKQP